MTGNSVAADWMIFVAILLAVGIGIACFIIWYFTLNRSEKRRHSRRRRRREHRKLNPTLAQTGGLPPPRPPNQPPRGA